MPRRNRPIHRYRYRPQPALVAEEIPTFEQMARAIVLAGRRSPLILERPFHADRKTNR